MFEPRAAGARAGNIEAINVSRPMQNAERGADRHVVGLPGAAHAIGQILDREHHLAALIDEGLQGVVGVENQFDRRISALDEKFLHARVGVVEQQLANGGLAVAPGAAGLLIIGFHAAGNFEVHDKADIGAIDPHAERVGRNRDVAFPADKTVLRGLALRVVQPAVVGDALDAPRGEFGRDRLHALARRAVHDSRAMLTHEGPQAFVLVRLAARGNDRNF